MTPCDLQIELRSDARWLRAVRGLVRGYLETCGIEAERAGNAVLGVDEACANAMRHSYDGDETRKIALALRSTAEFVEITLRDDGTPAAPEAIRRRQVETPSPHTVQPGGRGIQILYEVFDEVDFRPGRHSGNCVTMKLKTQQ